MRPDSMRRWKPFLPTLLLALTLAACGEAPADGGPAAPVEAAPECPKGDGAFPGDPNGPPPPTGAIPENFRTAWVFRCRVETKS